MVAGNSKLSAEEIIRDLGTKAVQIKDPEEALFKVNQQVAKTLGDNSQANLVQSNSHCKALLLRIEKLNEENKQRLLEIERIHDNAKFLLIFVQMLAILAFGLWVRVLAFGKHLPEFIQDQIEKQGVSGQILEAQLALLTAGNMYMT